MHIEEITKCVSTILEGFCNDKKLFFDPQNLWLEGISIDYSEAAEFSIVHSIDPPPPELMCCAGYLQEGDEDVDIYAIYSYGEQTGQGKVYFLTIVLEQTWTYSFIKNKWYTWDRELQR